MPQPFQDYEMQQLQNFQLEDFKKAMQPKSAIPSEIQNTSKIASLAHFLVKNFRDELTSDEHVIDTAIRLLNRVLPPNSEQSVQWSDTTEAQSSEEAKDIK